MSHDSSKRKNKDWDEMSRNEKIIGVVGLVVIAAGIIGIAVTILGHGDSSPKVNDSQPKPASVKVEPAHKEADTTAKPLPKTPKYTIISTTQSERLDKKNTYYVVIDPVDLSNDGFKQNVKLVVQAIAAKSNGSNFTANVYDRVQSANAGSSYYSNPPTTKAEMLAYSDDRAQHLVADYMGGIDMTTGKASAANSAYGISWYPGADNTTPNVGKYFAFMEQWKPTKAQ